MPLLPLIGCRNDRKAVEEYLEAIAPLLNGWVNGHLQTILTDRVSLSPMIEDLQAIRRRCDALEVPKPCRPMHVNALSSWD